MQKRLSWEAFSSGERNKLIDVVKNTIDLNEGCIMNFNMFSDLAISLSIEIEANKAFDLHQALSKLLTISDYNGEELNPNSTKEILVFMNISFSGGTGNLKKEIPAVPG